MVITTEGVPVDGAGDSCSVVGEDVAGGTTAHSMDQSAADTQETHTLMGTASGRHDTGSAKDSSVNYTMGEAEEKPGPQEIDPEAPDGGYGWFVVLGSFLVHNLIGGLGRSDGLFFLLFESRFQQSATLTAWPGAIAVTLRLGMGPLASAICQRWSVRACCMIGGLVLGLSQIITAYNTNFFFLFVSHGLLQGIGRGLLYGPSVVIVSMYFNKRRSLATGVAASGIGFGTLVLLPIIQFLFDTYGYTGGFFVLGAVCFNGFVTAMMFRPLFLHFKFAGKKGRVVEKPSASETVMLSDMDDAGDTTSIRSVRLRSCSFNQEPEADREARQGLIQHKLTVSPPSKNRLESKPSQNVAVPHQAPKKSSFWKSTVNILFPKDDTHKKTEGGARQKTKLFHFELLRDPVFCSFCLSIGTFTATFKSTLTFMPALAKSCGLTSSQAVFILALSGGIDTAGRIVVGYLLDTPALRKHRLIICNALLFLLAGTCALMPVLGESFVWLCVTSSLFGIMTGILASQKSVICVDLLGVELMPSAFGILLLFQAVGVGLGPLLSAAFRDAFGRFHEAFFLGAGLMAASACLMVYSSILHTVQKRHQKDLQNPPC